MRALFRVVRRRIALKLTLTLVGFVAVTSLAFLSARRLVSAGTDKTLLVWTLKEDGSKAGPPLDDAVIAAVNRWTFSPARKKGEAVSCWLNVGVPIRSSGVEASTASVATLGEPHTADQAHHTSRARQ